MTLNARAGLVSALVLSCCLPVSSVALEQRAVEREYDVREFLVDIPDFEDAPSFVDDLPPGRPGTDGRGGDDDRDANEGKTREQLMAEFAGWINATMSRDGVEPGARVDAKGILRVSLNEARHARLARLLERVRELRGKHVTVEARQLFFGDAAPRPADGPLADKVALAMAPGSRGVPLDDAEATRLLVPAERGRRPTIVTAPRVTLWNGQRAYVLVATQRAYVRHFVRAEEKDGPGKWEGVVDIVEAGVLLDVRASFEEPGGGVALDLRFESTRLLDMRTEPFAGAPAGEELEVQVPVVDALTLDATIATSDGGTMLIYLGKAKDAPGKGDEKNGDDAEPEVLGHAFLLVKTTVRKAQEP